MTDLLNPRDTKGRKCGHNEDVLNKPYLLYFDLGGCFDIEFPFNGCQTPKVCVEMCPTKDFDFNETACSDSTNFPEIHKEFICNDDVIVTEMSTCKNISTYIKEEKCVRRYWNSSVLAGIFQIPYAFRKESPILIYFSHLNFFFHFLFLNSWEYLHSQ